MHVNQLESNGRVTMGEERSLAVKVVVSLADRLVSDAIASVMSENAHVDAERVDLHQMSANEVVNHLEAAPESFHVLDLEALRQLETKIECAGILEKGIVLARPNELMLNGFSRTDVRALVSWDSKSETLGEALMAIRFGRVFVDPFLAKTIDEISRNGTSLLTNRQMQILRMVSEGKSSREIAVELHLSRRTVENHRARILERLRVNSAAEMLEVARRNNWI